MKKINTSAGISRHRALLLAKRAEISRDLRNGDLLNALAPVEYREGIPRREVGFRRFAAGAHGRCKECGDRIPDRRLDAVPWARFL